MYTEQLDILTYPRTPGFKDLDTSLQAAIEVKPKAEALRPKVLKYIVSCGHTGATSDECAEILGEDKLNIRPRFSELSAKGLIIKTDRKRKNENNKSQAVYIFRNPQEKEMQDYVDSLTEENCDDKLSEALDCWTRSF